MNGADRLKMIDQEEPNAAAMRLAEAEGAVATWRAKLVDLADERAWIMARIQVSRDYHEQARLHEEATA